MGEDVSHIFTSVFITGRGPAYFWTSVLTLCNGPVHKSRYSREIGRCVCECVRDMRVRRG